MWQDVNGHAGNDHSITDVKTGKTYIVNSVHHQMMRPHKDGEIVAISTNNISTKKVDDTGKYAAEELPNNCDLEVIWYEKSKSLCFQAHPEYFPANDTTEYFISLVNRYYKG
jgi:carbamoylphosphate synthase small subunit